MNKLEQSVAAAESHHKEGLALQKVQTEIMTVLKAAKFQSLESFQERLAAYAGADPAPKARKNGATKVAAKKKEKAGGIKRARLTDAQIAQMKALRAKKLSYQKVADEVGCSAGAVVVWEKNKFKRT